MDGIEIAEFLASQDTGVLSLAKENRGYAIPVSFAYVDEGPSVYLRLGYAPDSQKRAFLESTESASFVVYDETESGWKSVVVEGTLEERTKSALDGSIAEAVERLDIPFLSVHDRPKRELAFSLVRIKPSKLTGVVEAPRGQ